MHLRVENGTLHIDFSFWEKVWGLHRSFAIPLANIREVKHGLPKSTWWEVKMPGSFIPGVIKAGTFITGQGKEFWSVTRWGKQHITIELEHEKYKRIVLALPSSAVVPFQLEKLRPRILIASTR